MENKTILITGTTHGLGKQMSYLLAKNNHLILLGRNRTLLQELQIELQEFRDSQSIDYVVCDYIDKVSVYH
ncbi:MAG: SDR family NAD(P)-dependent oxidoreductase, partial [Acholeplasmataceae bacterium]|nr:SDR family NAD(P)-dependent oxidoreductase [Acholeplasmataceae bacterium]